MDSALVGGAAAAGTAIGGSLATGGAFAGGAAVAGTALVGAGVVAGVGALALGTNIVKFAKDPYIEYKKKGMSQKQREMFQREIESYKEEEGRGGNDNLSREIIDLIVEMIMELFK